MILSFVIDGRPRTWQRTNDVRGKRVTDAKQRAAKRLIGGVALASRPRGWPLDAVYAVEVIGHWPDRRFGDVDRLASLALDALEGVAYRVDRQVRVVSASVLLDRHNPRTEVTVVPYDEEETKPIVTIDLVKGSAAA